MGATFSTIYDIAIGDIDPAEAGSASGSLSSIQQLANAFTGLGYTQVWDRMVAGLGGLPVARPTAGALRQARARLGAGAAAGPVRAAEGAGRDAGGNGPGVLAGPAAGRG